MFLLGTTRERSSPLWSRVSRSVPGGASFGSVRGVSESAREVMEYPRARTLSGLVASSFAAVLASFARASARQRLASLIRCRAASSSRRLLLATISSGSRRSRRRFSCPSSARIRSIRRRIASNIRRINRGRLSCASPHARPTNSPAAVGVAALTSAT